MIKTVKQLVTEFGGTCRFAEQFRLSPQSVSNAIAKGSIPHSWRLPIYQEVRKRRIKVDDQLLGANT